jgi:hypothetical protein
MEERSSFPWVALPLVILFMTAVALSPIYIPPLSGRAIAEDIQMSENRTEEGVSCELPGTLVNESGDRAIQNNQKASVKSIPPIDLKVPESILTATFALG